MENVATLKPLVGIVKDMMSTGASLEDVIAFLRRQTGSKVKSMAVLSLATGISLNESKRVVHYSPAWSDLRERDDAFHEGVERILAQMQASECYLSAGGGAGLDIGAGGGFGFFTGGWCDVQGLSHGVNFSLLGFGGAFSWSGGINSKGPRNWGITLGYTRGPPIVPFGFFFHHAAYEKFPQRPLIADAGTSDMKTPIERATARRNQKVAILAIVFTAIVLVAIVIPYGRFTQLATWLLFVVFAGSLFWRLVERCPRCGWNLYIKSTTTIPYATISIPTNCPNCGLDLTVQFNGSK